MTNRGIKGNTVIASMLLLGLCVCGFFSTVSHAADQRADRKISQAQKKFVDAIGYPEQFIILFVHDRYDEKKRKLQPLAKSRSLEAWLYFKARRSYAIFDNGFFVEETRVEPDISGEYPPPARVRPQQFHPGMTKAKAARLFGEPDSVETANLGNHNYEVLRYLSPERKVGVLSLTFYDGRLVCVMAGLVVRVPDVAALVETIPAGSQ